MLTVIAVVIILLLGIVLLLSVPVDLEFNLQTDDVRRNSIVLVWLFGIIRIPLTGLSFQKQKKSDIEMPIKKTKRREKGTAISLVRNAQFRKRLFDFLLRLFRSIKIRKLDLQVRLGLDDPADTGRLWIVVGPFAHVLAGIRQSNIGIEPDFDNEVFLLQSHGRVSAMPLRILSMIAIFFFSPQVIHAIAFGKRY